MKLFRFLLKLYSTRLFFGIVGPIRRTYRYLFQPDTRGAKCVITCGNKVLLVRINYSHRLWTFPGGRVKRGEEYSAAAIREAREETGLLLREVRKIGEYVNTSRHNRDAVRVFHTELPQPLTPTADGVEIAEAKWFTFDRLPANRAPRVDQILAMLSS